MSLSRVKIPREVRLAATGERLKGVLRYNKVLDGKRRENSAEHSWHAALAALVFADWSNAKIDPRHAACMLIVHDLIEILAGDTNPFQAAQARAQASREKAAARALFAAGSAPPVVLALWKEFTAGRTPAAKYAKAIDKFMPMLLSVVSPRNVNRKVRFTRAQYVAEKACIASGSDRLWELCLGIIDRMDESGHFLDREKPPRRRRQP